MKTLLNVVHPYTFKLINKPDGLCLVVGENNEGPYRERDRKVASFMRQVLDTHGKIIVHNAVSPSFMETIFQAMTFQDDSLYSETLSDENVLIIQTAPNGAPILDEPKKLDEESVKAWEWCRNRMRTHCEIKYSTGNPDIVFFIGGALEACLGSFAAYHADNYSHEGQRLFYVPELSASFDEKAAESMKLELSKRNVDPISYWDAMRVLREGLLLQEPQMVVEK